MQMAIVAWIINVISLEELETRFNEAGQAGSEAYGSY